MNLIKYLKLVFIFALLVLLVVVSQLNTAFDGVCDLSERQQCSAKMTNVNVSIVKLKEIIELESVNYFDVASPSQLNINSAWLEGINMNMGKIPLQYDILAKEDQFIYRFYVIPVMCSERNMRWQVSINIQDQHNQSPLKFEFSTSW
ncbi:hypothetical protein [Catenovulum sediminis]|uniref:DUF4426 domain-containing protein n=1 Tax=Catenovulum sediminis TaxID=1740262 RepID=A0ABV1RJC4_9ALTE|nr:hypothetical protein [Catenovulum sediminis]